MKPSRVSYFIASHLTRCECSLLHTLSILITCKEIVPSKFLNVYDFGMKKYTSQPMAAQLFFQEDL